MNTVDTLRRMFIEEFDLDPTKVEADTDLTSLGVDSLAIIEFLFKIEDTFKVELSDRRTPEQGPVKTSRTLRDLAAELDALIAAQGPSSSTTADA